MRWAFGDANENGMTAFLIGARRLRGVLASVALLAMLQVPLAAQEAPAPQPAPAQSASPETATPETTTPAAVTTVDEKLSDAQLDQLVAPIALHPDSLLAQILTAATYPLEVEMAARWSKANQNVKAKELEDAMQRQTWDPSVKALTAVPQVLLMMSDKLDWTKQLGDAYLAQPDDMTRAIQRLRLKAADAGNLKTTKEQKITRVSGPPPSGPGIVAEPEYIAIEPVDPDLVYVPVYDPVVVYGAWPYPAYEPFYWYPPGYVAVGIFAFTAPCIVAAALWARYDWRARRIGINVGHYNAFNRTRLANVGINQSWRHNPVHRGNIAYSNTTLQQRFNKPGINNKPLGNTNPNTLRSNLQNNQPATRQGLIGNPNQNANVKRNTNLGHANPNAGVNPNARINQNANVNRNVNINRNVTVNRNVVILTSAPIAA